VLAGGGRRQEHGVAVEVGDSRAGGLPGEASGLEPDGAGAERSVVDDGARSANLEGVVNMRDVGGMPTLDGGTIASGRLIRSDNLQELSDAAIRRLVDELGVTDVVDLRTHVEVAQEGAGPLVGHPSVQISHFTLYADDSAESGIPDSERELPWETQARREAAARARREQANGDVRGTSGDQSSKPHIVPGGQDHDDFWSDHYLSYLGQRPESVVGALRGDEGLLGDLDASRPSSSASCPPSASPAACACG
jgi:hypothetical protein